MKKVIRLTESDLTRLVKRVIMEQKNNLSQTQPKGFMDKLSSIDFDFPDKLEVLKKIALFPIKTVLNSLPPVMIGRILYFIYENQNKLPVISSCMKQNNFRFPRACRGNIGNFQSSDCITSIKQEGQKLESLVNCVKLKY